MILNKRVFASILTVLVFLLGSAMAASAGSTDLQSLNNFNLTDEQIATIGETVEEYVVQENAIISEIETKLSELSSELKREDRFDTKRKEKKAARNSNKLVKDISTLYGQLIKSKVEYILKVKNVLTMDQRTQLVHSLEFNEDFFEQSLHTPVELDTLVDLLGLDNAQLKTIIRNRTDMHINALKIVRDIQYKVIDLEEELLKEESNPEAVDSIILGITDLGTKLIDNKVKYQLKSKDVLTVDQKKKALNVFLLMGNSAF